MLWAGLKRNYVRSLLYHGPGSVVGIATGYKLDGPGIEYRWGRDFPHLSRQVLGPKPPPVQWVLGLPRGKERPGRATDPSPPSSAVIKKEQSYTFTPPMSRTACTEPQCLYKGTLYTFFTVISSIKTSHGWGYWKLILNTRIIPLCTCVWLFYLLSTNNW